MPDEKPPRHVSIYSHPRISAHELRRIGVAAGCDPRAVIKYLKGVPVTAMSRVRVERGLKKCGYERLIIADDAGAGTTASSESPPIVDDVVARSAGTTSAPTSSTNGASTTNGAARSSGTTAAANGAATKHLARTAPSASRRRVEGDD